MFRKSGLSKSGTLKTAGLAAVMAIALAACQTGPTPYQPVAGMDGGYSETRIENNRYRIAFRGNSMTGKETVENYMLYRAAELTLQSGYDFFTIVNRDTDKDTRIRDSGGYMGTRLSYMYFVPNYGWVAAWEPYWTPSRFSSVTRYEAFAEILMGRGEKGDDPNSFTAREVSINLSPLIARPQQ